MFGRHSGSSADAAPTAALLEVVGAHAREVLRIAPRGSLEELYAHLLARAASARQRGDYAIAAALVVRNAGVETIFFGENTLFSSRDPLGHAEINALGAARRFLSGGEPASGDKVLRREAPTPRTETLLVCTLEPCPMCTVAILNAGLDVVLVAHEDPHAGALFRVESLAPLWRDIHENQRLEVHRCVPDERVHHGISAPLLDALGSVFFETKADLDKALGTHGVMSFEPGLELVGGSGARPRRRGRTRS